jgi:hypothetical protein
MEGQEKKIKFFITNPWKMFQIKVVKMILHFLVFKDGRGLQEQLFLLLQKDLCLSLFILSSKQEEFFIFPNELVLEETKRKERMLLIFNYIYANCYS